MYAEYPNVSYVHIDITGQGITIEVIPPVASPAGEGGKPPGGGHLRVALFVIPLPEPLS